MVGFGFGFDDTIGISTMNNKFLQGVQITMCRMIYSVVEYIANIPETLYIDKKADLRSTLSLQLIDLNRKFVFIK